LDDRSGGASALLGMDGFVVLSATECNDELWLLVETTTSVVGCENCEAMVQIPGEQPFTETAHSSRSSPPGRLADPPQFHRCSPQCQPAHLPGLGGANLLP